MKMSFRQTGGFAGIMHGCEIDTSLMKDKQSFDIESIARACKASPGFSKSGADLIRYEIEIHEGAAKREIKADDMTLTPEIAKLVEVLAEHARALPRK